MSILTAIRRAKGARAEPFIAPVLNEGVSHILAYQGDIPRYFTVRAPVGWALLQPRKKGDCDWIADMERSAYPYEYLKFLDELPRYYAIAVMRLDVGMWMIIPFNGSDAAQRGWPDGQPMSMHLVREGIKRYDIVDARLMGGTFLYGQTPLRGGLRPSGTDMHRALDMAHQYDTLLRQKLEQEAKEKQKYTTEGMLRDQVEFAGGNLLAWQEFGEGFEVTWEWEGHRLRTRVGREMNVTSVGFCTQGTATRHTLTSVVALLKEGIARNHYAVRALDPHNQAMWIGDDEEDDEWDW